jgi:putative ABC transport system permease protein
VKRSAYNIRIALEAVLLNRFRSFLTALGIIFGVAAVIAMMAIGNGARQEILEQIRLVGVNNIIIKPEAVDQEDGESAEGKQAGKGKFSPGLTLADAEAIKNTLPGIALSSPQLIYDTDVVRDGRRTQARLSGIHPDYFSIFNLEVSSGRVFSEVHIDNAAAVCVIGTDIRARFFPDEDPIGKRLKAGKVWLTVIGVLEHSPSSGGLSEMGIENHNENIYAPLSTVLLRFRDRSAITAASLKRGDNEDEAVVLGSAPSASIAEEGGHQLDRIIIQMQEAGQLKSARELVERMLLRRHQEVKDYSVRIPEMLLKQEQRTREIFNIVLGAIAGIALLVGGIGIMNIMLASVMERIKEIGVRQAMGARRKDIVFQFLAESTLISIGGGIIGVLLGIALSRLIMEIAGILTIISLWSVLLSFLVSAAVGILFGFMPARKAAQQDPVVSLRYE